MFKAIKKSVLLKVLSINSISIGISMVLGVFSSKIISVFLGTSGMALLGSFRNFSTMTKSISTIGINNSIVKLVVEHKQDKEELSKIYSTFFWVFMLFSVVISTLGCFFSNAISTFLFYSPVFSFPIKLFMLCIPFMVLNVFWLAIFNGYEKFKTIVSIQIISNILIFCSTAALIWKRQLMGGLLSIAIGELIFFLITLFFLYQQRLLRNFKIHQTISKSILASLTAFSFMALFSAVIAPLTLIFIRKILIQQYSIEEAGIWDALNRFSNFYMVFFSSGLTMYYMPKLASLKSEHEFKLELTSYFKVLVPLVFFLLSVVYFLKEYIILIAFSAEFEPMNHLLIWQLAGDFIKIVTLAFGFQVVVKTMVKRYFLIESIFNIAYFGLGYFFMQQDGAKSVVQAYFYANCISLLVVILLFRKMFLNWNSIPQDSSKQS
jgi:PST family polysaccharide transporter